MIIYFSATGNCKYVATRISEKTKDKTGSIIQRNKNNNYTINLEENEDLGIIIPTYFLGLPTLVNQYMSKLQINTKNSKTNYVYVVSTYGTTTGASTTHIEKHLKNKNLKLNAKYSLKMADTWTVRFDLSTQEKIEEFTKNTEEDLEKIINHITNKEEGNFVEKSTPNIISIIAHLMYENKRKTSNFNVEESCIGCGLCQTSCPIDAIKIEDNKPIWIKDSCLVCLRCLHRCPEFSIQYSDKTKNHGQYTNPNIKVFD